MYRIFVLATTIFDPIHHFWESKKTQSRVAGLIVILFLLALGAVQLNRWEIAPAWMAWFTPTSHFFAVDLAFTLVLMIEVVHLVFTVPCSISRSVGTQFEILALILLRSAFKTLADFPEPIAITGHEQELWVIMSDGGGAIAIFALLGVYTMLRRNLDETLTRGHTLFKFVAAKKIVALVILVIFLGMGAKNCLHLLSGHHPQHFFKSFYTVLIFSDIMLVLIAQRFLPAFRAVFRNSGFALATLLIRLALTAPPYYNVLIGVGSAVFACLLTLVYNTFYSVRGGRKRGAS